MKLAHVIDELVEEKNLDRSLLASIIAEGIMAAYEKKFPAVAFNVAYNKKNDELEIKSKRTVVGSVEDEDTQISQRKAKAVKDNVELGDELWIPFEGKIGRIEILRAKQVIAAKIRGLESSAVYNEFKDKKDSIVHAVIHKCERGGMTLKLGETLAFLPRSLSMPTDKCVVGYSIRALLKEVLQEPRNDCQLILDRASVEFVKKLFELEIPEIFEGLVEIKKIARMPGYKTKIIVSSNDINIDPVGTCVGAGGGRIKSIQKELVGEKIDVLPWNDSLEVLVTNSLRPAVVNRVEVVDNKNVRVWLDDEQRSLAIGKMGQNINLAVQLLGLTIELVQNDSRAEEENRAFRD